MLKAPPTGSQRRVPHTVTGKDRIQRGGWGDGNCSAGRRRREGAALLTLKLEETAAVGVPRDGHCNRGLFGRGAWLWRRYGPFRRDHSSSSLLVWCFVDDFHSLRQRAILYICGLDAYST